MTNTRVSRHFPPYRPSHASSPFPCGNEHIRHTSTTTPRVHDEKKEKALDKISGSCVIPNALILLLDEKEGFLAIHLHLLSVQMYARRANLTLIIDRPKGNVACINRETKESRQVEATGLLSPEGAALGKSGLSSGWLAEDGRAAGADDNGLGVREDGGDGEAAGALDIHEEGSGSWDKGLRGVKC